MITGLRVASFDRSTTCQNDMIATKRKSKKKKWRPTFKVRMVLAAVAVVIVLVVGFFSAPYVVRGIVQISGRCGLILEDIHVEGRLRVSEKALNDVLQEYRHQPMLLFSVADMRQRVRSLTWVKQATVRRVWPCSLYVKLTEFEPIATWHHKGKLLWVDRDGEVICDADDSMPQLPAISGEDAPHYIATFLKQVREYSTLWAHATAFSHIRKRRWNMMVGHTMLVKLPQDDVDQALKKLDGWLASGKIHPDQVAVLDLRMGDKFVFQLKTGVPVQVGKTG